jgi:hypothetical protein
MAPIITDFNEAYTILKENFNIISWIFNKTNFKQAAKLTSKGLVMKGYSFHAKIKMSTMTQLPIKFHEIGSFMANHGVLTTLDGCPDKLSGMYTDFNVSGNKLTNLVGGPSITGGYDACVNKLTSLDGLPIKCTDISLDMLHIPLLRLLGVKYTNTTEQITFNVEPPDTLGILLSTYAKKIKKGESMKTALWECQKELIADGYEEMARW